METINRSNWIALIGISIAGFLGCLDLTIVNTALPAIQTDLNLSVTQLQWVMTILLLALTAFMVVSGKLADIYGRRLCFYIGMGLFAISSLGIGFAPNIYYLIGFRFFQGLSIAFLYTTPVAMIPCIVPEHKRGNATGLLISANGLGLALGPVIGGFIVSTLGWRWIFFLNPPIIFISLLFCWNRLLESKQTDMTSKIDWGGVCLIIVAVLSCILVLVQGGQWGWFSKQILILLFISIISFIIFYFVESKVTAPIIEFHLLTNRIFLIGLAANFALALFYAVDFFIIPLYLHYIKSMPSYQIGLSLLPATVMVALLSSISGKIVDKHGPKGILCAGLLLFVVSGILQIQFNAQTSIYFIIFSYLLFGIGWAFILSPSIVASLSAIPKENTGVAMGSLGTLHNLGGAMGLALGILTYDVLSKSDLILLINKYKQHTGAWIDEVLANTDNAIQLMQKNTSLDISSLTSIFQHYFLKGYQGALYLIVISSGLALLVVFFGLHHLKSSNIKISSVGH